MAGAGNAGQYALQHGLGAGPANAVATGGGTNTLRAMGAGGGPPPNPLMAMAPQMGAPDGAGAAHELAEKIAQDAYLEAAVKLGIIHPEMGPPHATFGQMATHSPYDAMAPGMREED